VYGVRKVGKTKRKKEKKTDFENLDSFWGRFTMLGTLGL